jgi:hypothetical protein
VNKGKKKLSPLSWTCGRRSSIRPPVLTAVARFRPRAAAEVLLDLYRTVIEPKNRLSRWEGPFDESDLALLNLAVEFKKKSLGFQMKAIVEGWSQEELVREMY